MATSKYVTKHMLERAIRNYFEDDSLEIEEIHWKSAVGTGDNYCSNMIRAQISYLGNKTETSKTISIIGKMELEDCQMQVITRELHFFKKEIEMFSKTLPCMKKIMESAKITVSFPDCFFTTLDPIPILIVRDLKPVGYLMPERINGLDLEHCMMVMRTIAKFHATSAFLAAKEPKSIKNYNQGIYNEYLNEWITNNYNSLMRIAKQWPAVEKYAMKMETFLKKLESQGQSLGKYVEDLNKAKIDGFNVLNHGDLWTNNTLFKYCKESGTVEDLILIDYQLVHYTSPALDLHYFLATSPSIEVKEKHEDALLDFYYNNLIENLEKLKFDPLKIPHRAQFVKDFSSKSFHGLLTLASVTPPIKAPKCENASFDNFTIPEEEGNFRHYCYNNPCYRTFVELEMPYLDKLGVFNVENI